jgi:hypothetical protein
MSVLAEQIETAETTPTLGVTGRVLSRRMTVQVAGLPAPIVDVRDRHGAGGPCRPR